MLQDEYYIIKRTNNDDYPLFAWNQSRGEYGLGHPVNNQKTIKLKLSEPFSPRFEWVDYHSLPTGPVVSNVIADSLRSINIYGIQLVSAEVFNSTDPFMEAKNYWFIHVWNRINCLNKEKSDIDYDEVDGKIWDIDKLVLDEKTLSLFNLKKRLIFELTGDISILLVHQSIKAAIESVNPKGCRFFKASEWHSAITFE